MGKRGNGEGGIYRRADGVWCASVDLGYAAGRRRRKVVYGKTRRQVAEKLAAMTQATAAGRPVVEDSRRLGDYLEHWLREVIEPDRRPATAASYRDMMHRHIAPELGHIRLDRLAATDVRAFLRAKSTEVSARGRPLSSRSVRYLHAILRSALSQAVRDDLVSRNVCELVTPPRTEGESFRGSHLEPDQARALLAAAEGTRLATLWRLALAAGLRKGELLGLRWDDIDLERGVLSVRRSVSRQAGRGLVEGAPKTRESLRTLRLGAGSVAALYEHRGRQAAERALARDLWVDERRVFATPRGTIIDPRNLNRNLDELCALAGVPRIRVHDLRHTCVTLLLAEGEPLEVIAERLGHSDTRVTSQVYAHVVDALRSRAADRLDGVFD